jgi:hypothetical protein
VIRGLEAVLDEQVEVVTLVEDLAPDVRVVLLQQSDLAVLLGDELLVHRRDLDEQVLVGEEEIGSEVGRRLAVVVELDGEAPRLVLPTEAVEVEESGELSLAVVSEGDVVCRGREVDCQEEASMRRRSSSITLSFSLVGA